MDRDDGDQVDQNDQGWVDNWDMVGCNGGLGWVDRA